MSPLAPLVMLAPVLAAVAYFDLRFMRIPNALSAIAVGVLIISALLFPIPDFPARVVVALLVLFFGIVAFAFRAIGGGDVKILAVLMLFVPVSGLVVFANVFSASMIAGIFLVLAARRIPETSTWGWKSFGGSQKFPMGLSIALAGIAHPIVALAFQRG